MQVAARAGGEATLLRVGAAYQRETDWHLREPAVAEAA
jgi:Asp-tRNA(Asn)/Glu-tRNA(Gln) amidotransferase A subunit family amidase